ncbi:MAG: hypothetical protein GF311_00235 [Candidatus Lokiarchaeota archaeon]|nr:hypothetical protein [Candidatus Lokiarchaeota archaeon]
MTRDLGFDPLTFQPIDDIVFDKSENIKFARHHLDGKRFWSLFTGDLVLVDSSTHTIWGTSSLSDQKILMEGFHELIEMKGSGIEGRITERDIRSVFGNSKIKGKLITERWINDNGVKFASFLEEFNIRREMIKEGRIKDFIESEYSRAYTRFYQKAAHLINTVESTFDLPIVSSQRVPLRWLINFEDANFLNSNNFPNP